MTTESKTGVLLVNLGTPDAPTASAVRRYLAEFLWDPRVVEAPRWLWWLALHGVILRIRPGKVAKAYQSVWSEAGSPLLVYSQQQGEALQAALNRQGNTAMPVEVAMRYGNPSIRAGLEALRAQQVKRLLVLPLYPQYSATTTAAVYDAVADVFKTWRCLPELRVVKHYPGNAAFIDALKTSVEIYWQTHGRADRLLMSFHGIPERYVEAGDSYYEECLQTGRLLAEALALGDGDYAITFQSRFGREEWLKPYTDQTLKAWAQAGVRTVQVVCPGFSADCLETLEEIAEQNRDIFLQTGGESYAYIPALNASPEHIEVLRLLVEQHTQGWAEQTREQDA